MSIGFGLRRCRRLHQYSKIYSWKPCRGIRCTWASLLKMVSFKCFVECLIDATHLVTITIGTTSFQAHSTNQKFMDAFKSAVHYILFSLAHILDFCEHRWQMQPSLSTFRAMLEARDYYTTVPPKIMSVLLVLMMNSAFHPT